MFRGHRSIAIRDPAMSASLLTGLAVAETTVATTSPEDAGVEVLTPDASWEEVTRAEWTARAWQWWLSLPNDVNPTMTGQGCGYGQAGPVFFLPIPGELTRPVCRPRGRCDLCDGGVRQCSTTELPPGFGRNEDELVACTMRSSTTSA